MGRQIRSGTGWRLGWSEDAIEYVGLVGTDDWAIELTAAELQDFCRLVGQLSDTMQHMATELMDEERISCEVQSDRIWLEAEGYPHAYQLRLMLLTGRRAEACWLEAAVPEFVQATQQIAAW